MEIYIVGSKNNFTNEQLNRLKNLGNLIFIEKVKDKYNEVYTKSNEPKVIAFDPDLINWDLPNDLIEQISNLKGICLMSTSYSYVDVDYCKSKNIVVTNVPKYSTDSVAEYACFLMMAIARKLPLQIKNDYKEDFSTKYLQTQVKGKTAAIIGLGSIGTRIAQILVNMGLHVKYWSRNSRDERFEYNDLNEIFKTADFIFPTFLVNDETEKIITDELINSMKKTAAIISIVGTSIFNKELILSKVKNKELLGIGFESINDSINNYEGNVMVTSDYAWYTKEALDNCIEIWVQSIEGIVNNSIKNNIN